MPLYCAQFSTASHAPATYHKSLHFQCEQSENALSYPRSFYCTPSALQALELVVCAPRAAAVIHVLALQVHILALPGRSVFPHAPTPAFRCEVLDGRRESRSRGAQSQEPEDLLNDEYERQFEEKGRRVGGWEMEPSVSPPEHAHVHATGPPYAHIHGSHLLSAHSTALSAASVPHHLGRTSPAQLPGPHELRRTRPMAVGRHMFWRPTSASMKPLWQGNAHAHDGSRYPSIVRMRYDDRARDHAQAAALPGGGFPVR
ncbi:hypothetical protein DFH11DRAFT_1732993 [Phellopilus nigrolimitatus]|nr:hypothetical protein DFH11DRAFT_1732993 [Phellopilus nigrolimitatus]